MEKSDFKILAEQEEVKHFEELNIGQFFSIQGISQFLDVNGQWSIKPIYNYCIKIDERSAFSFSDRKIERITNICPVYPQIAALNFTNERGMTVTFK